MIFKSKEAIQEFIRNSEYIDSTEEYYDGGMNRGTEVIYQNDHQLYLIDYTNGHLSERWDRGNQRIVRGEYEACPVMRKVELVEEVTYERV